MAKEFNNNTKVLFCLLGLTLVYQACYQFLVLSTFRQEHDRDSFKPCWGIQNEEQRNGKPSVHDCAEVELFQNWQALGASEALTADPMGEFVENERSIELLAVDPVGRILLSNSSSSVSGPTWKEAGPAMQRLNEKKETPSSTPLQKTADKSMTQSTPNISTELADSLEATSEVPITPWGASLLAMQKQLQAKADGYTDWGADLIALQTKLEAQMQSLRSMRRSGGSGERSISAKIESLQRELCADPRRKKHQSCLPFASTTPTPAITGSTIKTGGARLLNSSEWIASLEVAQAKMEAQMHSLKAREASKTTTSEPSNRKDAMTKKKAALEAKLAAIAQQRADWERSLAARAHALGREMCEDPKRRMRPSCEVFLQKNPAMVATMQAQLEEPRSDPTRILKHPQAFKGGAKTFLGRRTGEPRVVTAKDLRGARWQARIPKVACIMAVPNSTRALTRLKYVVNNFRAQSYEGPRQLILVYHFQDRRAIQLVKKMADGTYIKAVAARTEVPSTTALRFGAYSADADADILAHWDFDSWHHPQRLAMQVRTLGLTGQSACLLKRWTVVADNDDRTVVSGGIGWAGSLVGEKLWMEKNWHPFLPGEEKTLQATSGLLAQLDMPELSVTYRQAHVAS